METIKGRRGVVRRSRERKRARGICVDCTRAARPGKATCQTCFEAHGKYIKRRVKRLLAAGMCSVCAVRKRFNGTKCCDPCRRKRLKWAKASYRSNHKKVRARVKASTALLKREIQSRYGGKCVCCGEFEPAFLTLDHVNGDGGKMRKLGIHRTGRSLYTWVIRNKFPKIFQLMCWNCNEGKRICSVCPHQER